MHASFILFCLRFDGGSVDSRRAWAFEQLYALIRSPTLPKEDKWVSTVLEFLLAHGLFVVEKANKKSKHIVVRFGL
jgi:DNA polymerase phi